MAANAVVLVIGGYQISIAKYLRGVSTLIYNLKEIGGMVVELECSRRQGIRADAATAEAMLKPLYHRTLRSVI